MPKIFRASNKRIAIIQIVIMVWALVIGARLVWLQVGKYEFLRDRADDQHYFVIPLNPTRGNIYDRNNDGLALSVKVYSLYAAPSKIPDHESFADTMSEMLDIDRQTLRERLKSNLAAVVVKRKLSKEEVAKVEALSLPGLHFAPEMQRFYIHKKTAAHVLGFVDIDEKGLGGIELTYDKLIRGKGGRLILNVDALKNPYSHRIEESAPGSDITLTIDARIQHFAEKTLAEAVHASRARGGTVVVLRPATGEILAMANYPTFDPNKLSVSNEIERHNRAIETSFEPGSVFKIVTYSAALEEGLITPDTQIDCGHGQIRIADRVIRDGNYGMLTATQALAKSSNVAAIKLGQRLGNERLASYIEKFGFGRRTGIELPGEARGLFREADKWGKTTIGSIPMGHEIGVTALQGAAAFAAIANGGKWIQPYLVARVTSASGEILEEHRGDSYRVVSESTATVLKDMLEGVVVRGTGKRAQVSGYRAAGKTGTAQKTDPATGRYSNTLYYASFAGFAPVANPEIACLVSLDEPKGAYHGGQVAAPVFAQVVAEALHILGVPPENDPQAGFVAGDFQIYDIPRSIIENPDRTYAESTDARPVIDIASDSRASEDASGSSGTIVIPDLTGRGLREAVALCAERGLGVEASGKGIVAGQSPPPGTLAAPNTICYLRLSKRAIRKDEQGTAEVTTKVN